MYVPTCKNDATFQASTSVVDTHWSVDDNLKPFVTHVFWSLEEEIFNDASRTTTNWIVAVDFIDLGLTYSTQQSNLFLKDGGHYRSVVKLCHTEVCFENRESDGFWVTSNPPSTGEVVVESARNNDAQTHLTVRYQEYKHEFLVSRPDVKFIRYHWTIVEHKSEEELVFVSKWEEVEEESVVFTNGMVCRLTTRNW